VFARDFNFDSFRQINTSAALNISSFNAVYGENMGLIIIFEGTPENNFTMHVFFIVCF